MPKPKPCILTIAGSDSGGGAGVQADARTIQALHGFACMAITAITAQNTRGICRWEPVPAEMIVAQIEAVLGLAGESGVRTVGSRGRARKSGPGATGGLPIRAIKTGLLPGEGAVRAIARVLRAAAKVPLVVDPVIGSTTGTLFLDSAGLRALRRDLLPLATLVTPNWPEAEALSGRNLRTFEDAELITRQLAGELKCAVLLKGGHAPGRECRDVLITANGRVRWFKTDRVDTENTHGTGCVLASAIATELGKGQSIERAVVNARQFLHRSLRTYRGVNWNGAGPAFPGR